MASTERLGRIVRVTVATLEVSGLDVEFRVEKTSKPEPNTCDLTIYNLSRDHRAQLEAMRPKKGDKRGIPVKIEAGYETTGTSQIWLGDLRTVESATSGPDVITHLASGDGERALQTSQSSKTVGPGTPVDVAIRALVGELGLGEGNVAEALSRLSSDGRAALAAPLEHGVVFAGPTARHMTDWLASAGLEWSIQDGAVQILNRGQALAQSAVLLDSVSGTNTGLIGSPTVDNEGYLHATMLMTPDVFPGRLVVLKSMHHEGNFRIERAAYAGDNFGGPFEIEIEAKRI